MRNSSKDSTARYYGALVSGDLEGWLEIVGEVVAGPHRTVADMAPDLVRRVQEMSRDTAAKHTVGETDWHVPVTDTWARAAGITVPTLAVNGALDAPDLIAMAERLVDTVAGTGHALSIEGTAHYANMEQPDTFTKHLLDWLNTLDDDVA